MTPVRLAPAERRAEILTAAQRLFSERPYDAVSTDTVAEAAGVTRGLLHHYFGTKRDLYVAVVREMFRGSGPPVPEYVAGATPRDRLAESVRRWLEMVEQNRETWFAALGAQGLGRDPEVEEILERVRERAVDGVIEVLGLGPEARTSDQVRALIRGYGGLAEATTRQWLELERLSRAEAEALLTESLLALVHDVLPAVRAAG